MDVYENIRKSGYELPPSPPKGGIYKPVKQVGNLLYISNPLHGIIHQCGFPVL